MKKKYVSKAMCLAMTGAILVGMGITPVFANPAIPPIIGGDSDTDVTLEVDHTGESPHVIKVSIPSEIPLSLHSKDGSVTVPDAETLKIKNLDDKKAVKITGISMTGKEDWTITNFDTDLASETHNTHKLGMQINDAKTTDGTNMTISSPDS